jgi:hypothetical protein
LFVCMQNEESLTTTRPKNLLECLPEGKHGISDTSILHT